MKQIKLQLRSFLVKIYYKFPFLQNLRKSLNDCVKYRTVGEIKSIIASAKKNNQPIFIQFPIINWSKSLFQRPNQLAKAMAERGYLTIYLLNSIKQRDYFSKIANNLYLTNRLEILEDLKGAIISVYLNYPPSDIDKHLTQKLFKNNTVFYEHVDHIDEQIHKKYFIEILHQRYENLKKNNYCNFVIGTSRVLYNELLRDMPGKQIIYLPNGVDTSHYNITQEKKEKFILPQDIKKIIEQKRKIIGFFGAIAPWIWGELIAELAEKRPEYFILMIGPEVGAGGGVGIGFPQRKNIYLTGIIDYQYLPLYAEHFDVSIIPFRLGDLAKATSPVKLFEYFAIGKPIVVTSDLIECTKFEGVASASSPDEFIQEIDKAIALKDKEGLKKKYNKYAEDNSWNIRAKQLEEMIINPQEN